MVPAEAVLDSEPVRIGFDPRAHPARRAAGEIRVLTIPGIDGKPEQRIGVIELPAFYQDFEGRPHTQRRLRLGHPRCRETAGEVQGDKVDGVCAPCATTAAVRSTKRSNSRLFIDKGPVVQVRESGGRVQRRRRSRKRRRLDGPRRLLSNRGSASASEIFAGVRSRITAVAW